MDRRGAVPAIAALTAALALPAACDETGVREAGEQELKAVDLPQGWNPSAVEFGGAGLLHRYDEWSVSYGRLSMDGANAKTIYVRALQDEGWSGCQPRPNSRLVNGEFCKPPYELHIDTRPSDACSDAPCSELTVTLWRVD